jgi:hypothetical protein
MSQDNRDELVITDLVERVVETDRTSTRRGKDHWCIRDYELEAIGPGRGLEVNPWQVHVPGPLTIRLGVSGHHRISLITTYTTVRLKLSGARCFEECEPVLEGHRYIGDGDIYRECYYDVEEVYWKHADLTGQDLVLDDRLATCLLAIRLTPVDLPRADTRQMRWPMMCTNDGGTMGMNLFRSPDELFERAERTGPDGCMRTLVYGGISADVCQHFTRVGTEFASLHEPDESWREHDVTIARNMQKFREWGINPAEAMVEYAHDRGWAFHFYIRMREWNSPVEYRDCMRSRFYEDHPEYRNVGPNGEPVVGMSIAYPQVREHLARFCAELAGFGADGVTFCYPRGALSVLYEPIVVDGFKKAYGPDPRKLPETDPRWLEYTAGIVTTFFREVQQAIGDRCRLSPMIHGTETLNRHFGLDVATWVREGIVGDLFIMANQVDRHGGHFAGGPEHLDFAYFQNLPGRDKVRLWPTFYTYGTSGAYPWTWEQYWRAMQSFLEQGADGYGFWDLTAFDTDTRANVQDLGKVPPPAFEKPQRLMAKYEKTLWDGYIWNRYTPIDST